LPFLFARFDPLSWGKGLGEKMKKKVKEKKL